MRHNPTGIPTQSKRIPNKIQQKDKHNHHNGRQEKLRVVQMRYIPVAQMRNIKVIHKRNRIYCVRYEERKERARQDNGEEEVLDNIYDDEEWEECITVYVECVHPFDW